MTQLIVILSAAVLAGSLAGAHAQTAPPQGQAAPAAPAAASTLGPSELVKQVAQGMLGDLDKDRAAYRRDPGKLSGLVDKYLLPHFDTQFAAQLVLGKNWRTATPDQRQRFINAFYHSVLTNYGSSLLDFTADRLKIYPTSVGPDATRATVRTEVKRQSGDAVSVNLSAIPRATPTAGRRGTWSSTASATSTATAKTSAVRSSSRGSTP